MAPAVLRDSAGDHLRAKAAELERQFEGYKRRLAERSAAVAADGHPDVVDDVAGDAGSEEEEAEVWRGRRYETYMRRRDKKLRQDWRARMERKEAEVKALWARLDRGHRPDDAAAAAAAGRPAREQKHLNFAKPMKDPATPRSSSASAMKLPRLRSGISSSAAAAAVSPRVSNRQALHREPPPTPRKENRMPLPSPAAAGAATTPRLKTLSRTKSSLKVSEEARSVRESPRPPPRRQGEPRVSEEARSYGGACSIHPPVAPSADAIAVARSCFREQVVLAEIRTAAAVAFEPLHQKRPGNGVVRASQQSVIPGHSDVEAKGLNIDVAGNGDDRIVQSSGEHGDAGITGDSDTEPSYVYIKKDSEEEAGSCSNADPKSGDEEGNEIFEEAIASSSETNTAVNGSPAIGAETAASRESSESLYSNVQSSFSHGSELDASAAGSPLQSPPSSRALSNEEVLEADAAMLRKKREEEEDAAEENVLIPPITARIAVPLAGQPPIDAVAGLKRFLPFGKKNLTKSAATVLVERAPPRLTPPAGPRLGFSDDVASDDLDYSYVISPHVRSLQSFMPSCPARSELKEMVLPPTKSPRVHRSFFSFSSFKNRVN